MSRKIYDIRPPKVVHKIEKEIKEFLVDGKKTKHHGRKKEGRSIWWPVSICILIIVLAAGVYLFFKLPKADISIWPKVDTLSFKQTITADKSADSVDTVNAVIPAQYFETTKTNSQDFPATGNASNVGQASGTITIYNKYDPPTPFTFKAGTHFMSDSGKLFVALQKVVIPAATKSGSKITPGSVQINVQAVEGGTDYNIAPANFSIPGLKGTSYYYSINATSTSAMTGGYSGKVHKVTDDDIQGAKDVLTQKTTSDAVSALKSQISSDYILLDNAVSSDVTSASTQTKSGTVAEDFNYQVAVTASALAFKKSDLDQFAKNYIISQMPDGKTMLDSSFNIDYSASTVDVSGGKATLNLDFSSGIYQNIDKNSIGLSLLGENANQITETINNSLGDQVSKVKINFWPFWVSSAPNSQKAINIQLKFQ
jgi:flagellar basal body-associated protein FliL